MEQAEILTLPGATWEAQYLEDTSPRRLVLEYYDREHLALRRYLSFLGVDPETAREILQDAFLKFHEHLLAGRDRTNLRAWLYRVVHNLARNAQTAFHSSKVDPLPEPAISGELRAKGVSAEEQLLVAERAKRLRYAMNKLTAAERECLLLRTQGLKYREIAGVLNISVSTVGENVQRSLEKLKELV
ncbi:MAG: sigma-70 family RNA polymerase sigma factor [Acidobacteriaceae bacterium]|nr:sigma-70 family RNA polymerase sigma factor [Acidobacteriaceae bacterium]